MQDVTGRTVQRALESVAEARALGYPLRSTVEDVGGFLHAWPENRWVKDRLLGAGFELTPPVGWTYDAAQSKLGAPEGSASLSVVHIQTVLRAEDQLEEMKEELAEGAAVLVLGIAARPPSATRRLVDFKDRAAAGRPAIEARFADGNQREIELRVPVHGWTYLFVCSAPESEAEALDRCRASFDSVRLDVVTPD
jgi:hypothetical protein